MGFNLHKILEGFGLTDGDEVHVKLAPGVVGNTTSAVVAALIATAAEAYFLRDQPAVMFGAMALTLILALVYLIGTWRFADKHPDLALMGGSELLQLRQLQLGAKTPGIIIEGQSPTGRISRGHLNDDGSHE